MGKLAPVVTIELDKPRNLKLTLNGMIEFKKAVGKEVWDLPSGKPMASEETRALLWACLIHEDKALTLTQVGDMLDMSNLLEVSQAIMKAYGLAMPEPEKETDRPLATIPSTG